MSDSTPISNEKGKRELSSPFDPNEQKKAKSVSVSSESSDMEATTITLRDEDLLRLSNLLTQSFQPQMKTMITDIVQSVTKDLINRVNTLENESEELKEEIKTLKLKLENAEDAQDKANQYSRRNCLRLSGIKEEADEDTDTIVVDIARAIGVDLNQGEIDRSHRLGKTTTKQSDRAKPRDIIIKFSSYRSRSKMIKSKAKLRKAGFQGAFLNEDLTRTRSEIFYECRRLVRNKQILSCWTADGTIIVKTNDNNVTRIETKKALADCKKRLNIGE